jgi:PAS domain S-box-containing protein
MMRFLFKRPAGVPAPAAEVPVVPAPAPASTPAAPAAPQPAVPAAPAATTAAAPAAAAEGAHPGMVAVGPARRTDHKSLYKQLLRGFYDAVLVTDPKGHVIDSNHRVQDFFQYDKNEAWDMDIGKLIPGINRQLLDRVRQGLADNRHVLIDARCARKDGSVFPAEVAISAIDLMNEGDLVFTVRNVERRKRQFQLYRSLQNAMANDLSAVACCDRDGKVVYANTALRELWGCTKDEEIINQPVTGLWPADPQAGEPLRKAQGGERWMGVLRATARSGRSFAVAAAVAPDLSSERETIGAVCAFIELHEA